MMTKRLRLPIAGSMFALFSGLFFALQPTTMLAQLNRVDNSGNITQRGNADGRTRTGVGGNARNDSLGSDKEIPIGISVWTVDEQFGDRSPAQVDTLSHMFQNTIFTTGLRGEYNTTGNLGAPRINRIFIDRQHTTDPFIFIQPYDYFLTTPRKFHFTNTLSPFTNLTYNSCGNRTNGENHLTAQFGVNAGKRTGIGFKFNYLYGRGYYDAQSTSLFNYTLYGSHIGDRYQAHVIFSTNHQKVSENGGITDDNYITHPESFSDSYQTTEIPTVLEKNWNRNDNQHVFLTHRYSMGFHRKVRMTDEEIQARKFALAAQKDQQERLAREEAMRNNRSDGANADFANTNGGDKRGESQTSQFAGRPDDAKIAGSEPTTDNSSAAETDVSLGIGENSGGRIAVDGKAAADSLMALEHKNATDTAWLKNEYVPVTSVIHTLKLDHYRRIYQAYQTPADFYANTYAGQWPFAGDSIYDKTRHIELQNTFALSLLEGFNKWAKAGIKVFVASYLRHINLPDSTNATANYNEHTLSIGGQLSKTMGNALHYNAKIEAWVVGKDAGQLKIDATGDLNLRVFSDTLTLAVNAFVHHLAPTFYYRHYHSKHLWWDHDDLDHIIHTRMEGLLSYQKSRTTLRVAIDEIKNHTYFAQSYRIEATGSRTNNQVAVRQCSDAITLFTASLSQDVTWGPLNWESVLTYQKSTKESVLPVPQFNLYTNLYLRFKIAHVLKCDFGGDVRYFTRYYAPDYSPALGQFTVQEGSNMTKTGNYPLVNVYANFHLKRTRFFAMFSHVNAGSGKRDYFLTPHYPLNGRVLRLGISWNFFN